MKLKKLTAKKILYYILLGLLTIGASLIIGFLSFGGLYALWPILPLAGLAMFLSVAYEGEIYLQNIKGALNKLFFKSNYLQQELANEFLVQVFPDIKDANYPPQSTKDHFFKDYEVQLKLVHKFGHKKLDKESKALKRIAEKKLRAMDKWFADQLTTINEADDKKSAYQIQLHEWLRKHKSEELKKWQNKLSQRQLKFTVIKVLSAVAALAMGLGTTYLLMGEFAAIAFLAAIPFAALPAIIIPAAIIAGAAYGLLTYNAVTDMLQNETVQKWWRKTKLSFTQDSRLKFLLRTSIAVFLIGLAAVLTVLTAGTWWTVAKNSRPLFVAMSRMPWVIMGLIVPVITGLSSGIVITQNTFETLERFESDPKKEVESEDSFLTRIHSKIDEIIVNLKARENYWQIANPFRIILTLTFTPLHLIAFAGHIISIALTSDRMPGIPELISAFFVGASELGEDYHYFVPHKHKHINGDNTHELLEARFSKEQGHNHAADIPTKMLKTLFWPLRWASMHWDLHFSQRNDGCDLHILSELPVNTSSVIDSYCYVDSQLFYINAQGQEEQITITDEVQFSLALKSCSPNTYGTTHVSSETITKLMSSTEGHTRNKRPVLTKEGALEKHMDIKRKKNKTPAPQQPISIAWEFEQNIAKIERHKQKKLNSPWFDNALAKKKSKGLSALQKDLRELIQTTDDQSKALPAMVKRIQDESQKTVYSEHRYRLWNTDERTATQELLEDKLNLSATSAA